MTSERRFHELDQARARLQAGGGPERIEKQHRQGKLTARERLALLFDADSFVESGLWVRHRAPDESRELPRDGVITGKGEIDGRPVIAFSQDFTVGGGAVGALHAAKIVEGMRTALKCGMPMIGFNDSGGARIQEGVEALSGYGQIFYHNTLLSGVVPQISVIAGPCAGGAAYSPALTDFVIQVERTSHMFIAGPEVIRAATGEVISEEELGGARAHASIAGNGGQPGRGEDPGRDARRDEDGHLHPRATLGGDRGGRGGGRRVCPGRRPTDPLQAGGVRCSSSCREPASPT
jgi:acetyl-CoA carboxylase carboxyltransferase component